MISLVATDECISDGIRQCGYFDFDGSIDKLHPKLHDTIKDKEVPYNLFKKVNIFIDEIKAIGDDEAEANDDEALYENSI